MCSIRRLTFYDSSAYFGNSLAVNAIDICLEKERGCELQKSHIQAWIIIQAFELECIIYCVEQYVI